MTLHAHFQPIAHLSGDSKQPKPVTPFDESVYALIPEKIVTPPKSARYRSKYANQAREEYVQNRKESASMGPLKVKLSNPDSFLKSGEKTNLVEIKHQPGFRKTNRVKSHVNSLPLEKGVIIEKTAKNYITQNALENINAIAKKPLVNKVKYIAKKDYGKTPAYIQARMQELAVSKTLAKQDMEQSNSHKMMDGKVILPETERVRILEGLKANWEQLNSDYMKLSLTVDTVPKITRKVNLETQLKTVEEYIAKFSRPLIMVDME